MYALIMSGKIMLFTCTAGGNAVKLMSDCLRAQTAIKQHKMCIYDKNHSKPHHSDKTKQKCTAF